MFGQCSALAPLAKAVRAVLGWQWSTTVLPGHGELAVAAGGIVLGLFWQSPVGVIHSVPYMWLRPCPPP